MKKILALLMAVVLTLSCVSALAEDAKSIRFVEDSPKFDIEMAIPEGATAVAKDGTDQVNVVEVTMEGIADVLVTIAGTDVYDDRSMNDLTEEEIEALKLIASEQYEEPLLTVDETPSGNKYIHICANSEVSDIDAIFTLYLGYFVQLTQWHEDYAEITEKDFDFMKQLLYNIEFIPLA